MEKKGLGSSKSFSVAPEHKIEKRGQRELCICGGQQRLAEINSFR